MQHTINLNHEPDYPLLNELFHHQDQLFERYSKLLMLRIDFAYHTSSNAFENADAAHMNRLTEQCHTIKGLVGYAWVMEHTETHGFHIHAAFYINGQAHRKIWEFWEQIKNRWENITGGEGYAHRCEPKPHYRVRGEWVVSFSDKQGRRGMQYILSYLAKQSQRMRYPIYRLSNVPAPSRRGRPRSQS